MNRIGYWISMSQSLHGPQVEDQVALLHKRICVVRHLILLWIVGILNAQVAAVRAADEQPTPEASLEQVTGKLESGEPLVFATFGDSITWPCYHTDFRQNYITLTVDALQKAYPKASVQIVHAGNMGTTGRGLAETPLPALCTRSTPRCRIPDVRHERLRCRTRWPRRF